MGFSLKRVLLTRCAQLLCGGGALLFAIFSLSPASHAQDAVATPAASAPAATASPMAAPGGAAQPGAKPGGPVAVGPDGKPLVGPDGKPVGPDGKPLIGPDGKPIEAKPGETKPMEPPVAQRPMKPANPPNPEELKVRPDSDGKVRLSFSGQPWPLVLEWVATISNMSLDWQELPGDYLNLATQQSYTVEEVRDLINRHLLARGYTMLRQDEMLTVVNIKKLDPGMVPRVAAGELAKRSPYEYVKVSFTLDWLIAESAAEELKPMVSPNGKLTALKNTNRLEAIDAVVNLREIYSLLTEEQSNTGQERLVKEFVLDHARAVEVQQHLNTLLGIEDKSKAKQMTPEEIQMQQQAQMMAQQRGQPMPQPEKPKGPPINLVVNIRKNSIIANAPPDKMAIIEQAIKVLDVQADDARQLLANMHRMQVYRLSAIDPEPLVKTLNELGVLDPTTRLEIDKRNRSIIAYAELADHVTIRAMVEKLDGSGRQFEVIQLRRLEADYVAGSIEFMIGGGKKEETQQRRPYYYDYGMYFGGRNQQEETSNDKFRVDADVENNRLLVWANKVELDEVTNLLAKLGEIPARGNNTNTVRVLQVEPGKDADAALERIRRAWPQIAPNPLVMPPAGETRMRPGVGRPDPNDRTRPPVDEPEETSEQEAVRAAKHVKPIPAQLTDANGNSPRPSTADQKSETLLAQATTVERSPTEQRSIEDTTVDRSIENDTDRSIPNEGAEPPELGQQPLPIFNPNARSNARLPVQREPAPITVNLGLNGELIVTSSDTAALDAFEEMMMQVAPSRRDYQVFYLRHASATWVSMKLEDYFEIEDKSKKNNNNRLNYWLFGGMPESEKSEARRLSRRKELKFITDIDTNTILVQGADPGQLKLITELIDVYDQPEPLKSKAARVTVTFTLKYSKAKVVGEAVKDVYRDLLSSNDKALQGNEQQQKNKRPDSQNVYITNLGGEGEEGGEKRTQVSFKGKLSLGIDELSNTLVVSTEGQNLMQNVSRMIESLDEAARPSKATVEVVKIGGQMDSGDVRKAIARILAEQQQRQQQPQMQPGMRPDWQQQQMQPGQNGSGGNGNGYQADGQGGQGGQGQ